MDGNGTYRGKGRFPFDHVIVLCAICRVGTLGKHALFLTARLI